MRRYLDAIFLSVIVISATKLSAGEKVDIAALLSRPIIGPELSMQEVQEYTAGRVPPMPDVKTVAQWERHAKRMRADALGKSVFKGQSLAEKALGCVPKLKWHHNIGTATVEGTPYAFFFDALGPFGQDELGNSYFSSTNSLFTFMTTQDGMLNITMGITLNPGARTLVQTMKSGGAYTALVSGGFTVFTRRVRESCGFDEDRANRLLANAGALTGRVAEPILGRQAKLAALQEIAAERRVPLAAAIAVGDGANDSAMLAGAGLGVGYRPTAPARVAADVSIDQGDLTALLYLQGYRADEFVN